MLLLIALAHAPFWLSASEVTLPGRPVGGSVLDDVAGFLGVLLVDSRAFPLFAVLFGYGLTMMVDRQLSAGTSEREARRLLRHRALYLLLFGFVNAVVIGGIDILADYGFATLLIGWILFRGTYVLRRAILLVSLIYLIILPAIWFGMTRMTDVSMNAMVNTGTDSYLRTTLINLVDFPFTVLGGLFVYPILLPILIGIWAARAGLIDAARRQLARTAVIGILVSVVGALPLAVLGTPWWAPSLTTEVTSTVLHMVTGIAGGIGYAAIFALLGPMVRQVRPLAGSTIAMGKRSLTFFLFIELMLVVVLSPVAFGLGQTLHVAGATVVAVSVWLISLVIASIMERRGIRGPADALLRRLTYRR